MVGAGDAGGGVQEPVADRLPLGWGQLGSVLQEDGLGPGEQVSGGQSELQPDGVDREELGRQAPEAGVLGLPDAVLDPGVRAVTGFQERQLPDPGVGGDGLVAPAVSSSNASSCASGWGR